MKIAVFGDTHGKLLLLFELVKRLQKKEDLKVDLMLSVGDAGIFPSFQHMDKASKRYAKKFPEELGFSKFFYTKFGLPNFGAMNRVPVVDEVLAEVDASLYFVPGNHEDHQFLGNIYYNYSQVSTLPFAVDLDYQSQEGFAGYARLRCLPQGPVVTLHNGIGEQVTVRALNGLEAYTMPEAWKGRAPVDVLLTHECPHGRLRLQDKSGKRKEFGNHRINELIDKLIPRFAFFGHHHWHYHEMAWGRHGRTRSIGMNEVNFERATQFINSGCFGLLDTETWSFDMVDAPWFRKIRKQDVAAWL